MTENKPLTVIIRAETRNGKFIPADGTSEETWTHRPTFYCGRCGTQGNVWNGKPYEGCQGDMTAEHACTACGSSWHQVWGIPTGKAPAELLEILRAEQKGGK